jgi:putative transposase
LRQFLQQHGRDAIIDLDESGFEPEYPTLWAWSPRGQVVYGERSSQRRPRRNLIAARNPQEFLAPMIVSGSITAVVFETCLAEHLCPVLAPHSLLGLDNARFHRPERVNEIAAAAGHQVLFLPPYSPDFNKIEHDFAALKKILAYAPEGTTLDEVVANYRCA